jgi:two-component system sensor histidine kinase PilS (NtrC family)
VKEFSAGYSGDPTIKLEFSDGADLEIEFDPLHLSQILGNLCQNGLRYSEKQTGEAELVIRSASSAGLQYLEVIDFGEGVSEELIPNLFEPFYTTEVTGTGLGLYLSKELCEANNARLSYSNSEHSTFRISFLGTSLQQFIERP